MGLHLSFKVFDIFLNAKFTSESFEQEGKVEFSIQSVNFLSKLLLEYDFVVLLL